MSIRSSSVARLAILVFAMALAGCAGKTLSVDFEAGPRLAGGPYADALLLQNGGDERPLQGRTSIGGGFMILIPLIPYGTQYIDPHIGAYTRYSGTGGFAGDVLRTILGDLRAAGLARSVYTDQDQLPGRTEPEASHTLRVTLREGIYRRHNTTYALSIAGALLWFVGFPNSYGAAELAFDVAVFDRKGDLLSERSFHTKETAVEWLVRPPTRAYSSAMLDAYGRISPELRGFVRETLTAAR